MGGALLDRGGGGLGIGASALVLGGGKGSRIGGEKLFLRVEGRFLLELVLRRLAGFAEAVVVAADELRAELARSVLAGLSFPMPVRVVHDRREGLGPLEGLAVGLAEASEEWAFAVGCDMPWINEAVVRSMAERLSPDVDVVCCRIGGYLEPLHAFYSRRCLAEVERALEEGKRRLRSFYDAVRVLVVEEHEISHIPGYARSFAGVNSEEDLFEYLLRLWLSLR